MLVDSYDFDAAAAQGPQKFTRHLPFQLRFRLKNLQFSQKF
jgi:hypothetical protein